jgi:phosphate transport system protein
MDEIRKNFHNDLESVRAEVIRLGASLTESIPRATAVLLSGDLEGADYLVQADDEFDGRSAELEVSCFEILALQAPVAADLRQIVAIIKIAGELERSADLVVNICKAARRIYGHDIDPMLRGVISKMSEQAQKLFAATMEAFEESDSAKAAAIDDMDSYLDSLHRQFESHSKSKIDLQVAVQLAVVARFYERIGDHAVNVSEKTRFIVSGWVRERGGIDRYKARVGDRTGEIFLPRIES